MTFGPGRFVVLAGLLPTLVTALLSVTRPAWLQGLEYGAYDTLLRAAGTHAPAGRIVIVDIDERSLAALGQWPWRRDVLAQLVDRLRGLGASVVALDIMFAEPDRYEGAGPDPDLVLAESLRRGSVVLGYALTFDSQRNADPSCMRHPLGVALISRDDDAEPYFQATGAVCNLPALTEAAPASGFMNAAPDPDGILRRAPLLLELHGHVYPGLALAAVNVVTGASHYALTVMNVNAAVLSLDALSVPLDGKSNVLLRFRGPKRTFPYVSAVDVLRGPVDPTAFADRIVFVGTTALGTREVVSTPLDTQFVGVEVQATIADNLLQQDAVRRPEFAQALETQIVIGLGLVGALVVRRFGLAWGAVGATAGLVGAWWGASWLMSDRAMYLSPLFPTIGMAAALGSMTLARVTLERQRADQAGEEKTTSQKLMVQALLSLTEVRDAETGKHSRRTQHYARVLATQLSTHPRFCEFLTPARIELLSSLAPLHDIGKVGVPDGVLNKPGQLTAEELIEMRKHPAYGRDVILNAQEKVGVHDDAILSMAKDIVYTHHEKWDGTGYPQGLHGAHIPIPGRIMAVVDVYDASTTRRLYRSPMSHEDVVRMIAKGRGTHFDPDVVDAFVRVAPVIRRLSAEAVLEDSGAAQSTSTRGSSVS